MIILDTNQLDSHRALSSPTVAILKAITAQTGEVLAIPQVVEDEFLAHYGHVIEELYSNIDRDVGKLRAIDNYHVAKVVGRTAIGDMVGRHRELLESIFTVLPWTEDSGPEAMRREVARELPAKTSWEGKGAGARDAAVWLAALDQMNSDGTVYLVSNDQKAFGSGALHPELQSELAMRPGALRYFNRIDDLLGEFADRQEVGAADFEWVLQDSHVHLALADAGWLPLYAGNSSWDRTEVNVPVGPLSVVADGSIESAVLYRLGSDLWLSIRVNWQAQIVTRYDMAVPEGRSADGLDRTGTVLNHVLLPSTLVVQLADEQTAVAAEVASIGPLNFLESEWVGDTPPPSGS